MIRKNLTIVVAAFAVLFASCEADKKTSTSAYGAMDLNVAKQSSLVNDLEIVEECLVSNDDGCLNLNIPSHNLWWPEKLHKSKLQDYFSASDRNSLLFTEYNNGTARLIGTTKMGSCVISIELWYNDKIDPDQWLNNTSTTSKGVCDTSPSSSITNKFYTLDNSKSSIKTLEGDCGFRGLESFGVAQKESAGNLNHYGSRLSMVTSYTGSKSVKKSFNSKIWVVDKNTEETLWPLELSFNLECANSLKEGCKTIYSYRDNAEKCFTSVDEENQPAWTLGPLKEGIYSFKLYAKTSNCQSKIDNSVGSVAISYENGKVLVTYNIHKEYALMEANTYAGKNMLPINEKGETARLADEYIIEKNLNGEIFLVTQAVICPKEGNKELTL